MLSNNLERKRYELEVEGKTAFIEYILAQGKIYLTHTEVPKSLEGQGIGSKLVKLVLEDIQKSELKLMPLCPFVAAYIKRHPEWTKLLAEGINIE
jgi:predicted GNAT family acetyltransferase